MRCFCQGILAFEECFYNICGVYVCYSYSFQRQELIWRLLAGVGKSGGPLGSSLPSLAACGRVFAPCRHVLPSKQLTLDREEGGDGAEPGYGLWSASTSSKTNRMAEKSYYLCITTYYFCIAIQIQQHTTAA